MKHGLYFLTAADTDALVAHYKKLSSAERYYRFGRSMTDVQLEMQLSRMNWEGSTYGIYHWGALIGVAHIIREDADSAEFAVSVNSEHQGHGIGARLLDYCMELAETRGIKNVDIYYISENQKMAKLASKLPGRLQKDGPESHKSVSVADWVQGYLNNWTSFNVFVPHEV